MCALMCKIQGGHNEVQIFEGEILRAASVKKINKVVKCIIQVNKFNSLVELTTYCILRS